MAQDDESVVGGTLKDQTKAFRIFQLRNVVC